MSSKRAFIIRAMVAMRHEISRSGATGGAVPDWATCAYNGGARGGIAMRSTAGARSALAVRPPVAPGHGNIETLEGA
jgi:hypothetical protein